jgi:hypothetical protein
MKASALSRRAESSDEDGGADSATGDDDAGVVREDKDGSQSEAKDEAHSDLESGSDHHVASGGLLLSLAYEIIHIDNTHYSRRASCPQVSNSRYSSLPVKQRVVQIIQYEISLN